MSVVEEISNQSDAVKDDTEFDVEADEHFEDDFDVDPTRYIFYR